MKKCRGCEKTLPVSEFKRDRGSIRGTCRTCVNRRTRERRANDPEYAARLRERWNSWYQRKKVEDPDFMRREWERESARRQERAADPEWVERHKAVRRRHQLKASFGISDDQYAQMFARQEGRCAICGGVERAMRNGRRLNLAVDHDHETGAVRSLLCSRCNNGLGRFCDDPVLLRAAADYIESHR